MRLTRLAVFSLFLPLAFGNLLVNLVKQATEHANDVLLAARNGNLDVVGATNNIASKVQGYAQDQLEDLALKYALASDTFEELRDALSNAVASAEALRIQLQTEVELVKRSKGDGAERKPFDMAAFQERFKDEIDGVSGKLTKEFSALRLGGPGEVKTTGCVQAVSKVLGWVEDGFINSVIGLWGLPEDTSRQHFRPLRTHLERIFVIICKMLTAHPYLLPAIMLLVAAFITPQIPFLLPILKLFGFGPLGIIKGSLAALAQSYFFGPTIAAGSWFSLLQKLAMKAGGF